jgi:integron integrase
VTSSFPASNTLARKRNIHRQRGKLMNCTARPPRLQDQVRAVIRTRRYSRRTEKSYWYWIRYFIRFHDLQHPSTMGPPEVQEFLTWLAVKRNVAAATQNQALNALVFLYGKVLEQPLGNIGDTVRAKRPRRLPVVLSHDEAMAVITTLGMPYRLMASLMYGAGLRVVESARLRVKDIDLSHRVIIVRNGKGGKDRTTLLPQPLCETLRDWIITVRQTCLTQTTADRIPVTLPFALARKYPSASTSVQWQWLFPSVSLPVCAARWTKHTAHRPATTPARAIAQNSGFCIAPGKSVYCSHSDRGH